MITKETYSDPLIQVTKSDYELVFEVAEYYRNTVMADAVAAWNPAAHPWYERRCGFRYDVTRAVIATIQFLPNYEELCGAWDRIMSGCAEIGAVELELIELLAPVFRERNLYPVAYFA